MGSDNAVLNFSIEPRGTNSSPARGRLTEKWIGDDFYVMPPLSQRDPQPDERMHIPSTANRKKENGHRNANRLRSTPNRKHVKQHSEEMANTPGENKQMPDRMIERQAVPKKKRYPGRVRNAARKQPANPTKRNRTE